jgi:2-phosphoglycerate kinase
MRISNWDVLLIGGASGVGKSSLAYPLARNLDVAIAEADDLFHAVEAMTTPEQLPALHYWRTHPEAELLPPERILELHLAACRTLVPAIAAVIRNHIETRMPVVLEGDYILPANVLASGPRTRAVFLVEHDEARIVANLSAREPSIVPQNKRARVSFLFGQWLRTECARYSLPVIAPRPFETVLERALSAVAADDDQAGRT